MTSMFKHKKTAFLFGFYVTLILFFMYISLASAEVKYAVRIGFGDITGYKKPPSDQIKRYFNKALSNIFRHRYVASKAPGFLRVEEEWFNTPKDDAYYTAVFSSGPQEPPKIFKNQLVFGISGASLINKEMTKVENRRRRTYAFFGRSLAMPYEKGKAYFTSPGQFFTTRSSSRTGATRNSITSRGTNSRGTNEITDVVQTNAETKTGGGNFKLFITIISGAVVVFTVVGCIAYRKGRKSSRKNKNYANTNHYSSGKGANYYSSGKGGTYSGSGKDGSYYSSNKDGSYYSSSKDGTYSGSSKGGSYYSSGKDGTYSGSSKDGSYYSSNKDGSYYSSSKGGSYYGSSKGGSYYGSSKGGGYYDGEYQK